MLNALAELSRASHVDTPENFQPIDATLTALAGLDSAAGLVTQIGADAFTKRTLTTTANHLSITNPAGTAGNPLLELAVGALLVNTWTPTLFNTANVAASTSYLNHYIRIGNQVICWGRVDIDPTAGAGAATILGISLPIASTFATTEQCFGVAATAVAQRGGAIVADVANGRATINFASETTANAAWGFLFGFQII